MKYEIVFFDVDGTLLDNDIGTVEPSTINAVKSLTENGIKVVIATGRPQCLVKDLGEKLGVDSFITCNGSYVELNGEVIEKITLPKTYAELLLEKSNELNDSIVFFDTKDAYSNGLARDITIPSLRRIGYSSEPKEINQPRHDYLSSCLFLNEGNIKEYESLTEHLKFYKWETPIHEVYDVQLAGINKINGVRTILKHFNIDKSKSLAFGDGDNDIKMLIGVGTGIAMGNARDKLKNVADIVTKSVSDNGIEFALKELELI